MDNLEMKLMERDLGFEFEMRESPVSLQNTHLFNSLPFLARNNDQIVQFFIIKGNNISGCIHFTIKEERAYSPWKASFGGLEVFEDVPQNALISFVSFLVEKLKSVGIDEIQITGPPEFYHNATELVFYDSLAQFGFNLTPETGQLLEVTDQPFDKLINRYEAGKLKKAIDSNMIAEVISTSFPKRAYKMILDSRQNRNIPVTIKFKELKENYMKFSDHFICFTIRKGKEIAAASTGIRVKRDVLYHFFPGSDEKYNKISPMVLLIANEYGYCQRNNIRILDLGLSSEKGIINEGLYRFKANLGATDYQQMKFKFGGK